MKCHNRTPRDTQNDQRLQNYFTRYLTKEDKKIYSNLCYTLPELTAYPMSKQSSEQHHLTHLSKTSYAEG